MMTAKPLSKSYGSRNKQTGASLFIALVILLLVTLLALSSTREVALESRITANFVEQQRLSNGAEAGLRDGEYSMINRLRPLEPTASCATAAAGTVPDPCLLKLRNNTATYSLLFATAGLSRAYYPKDGTQADSRMPIVWYALPAPGGAESGEAENPEYGNMMNQTGTFRYEVNAKASTTTTSNAAYLRSTTAKLFDNGDR
ncbi:PilX N-terminal domain-containing pilus assembly protein [Pseudomonas sp. GD04087]|uniref:PilX N-terminal domain-containing pilus assembly protein n=1 Tax=Pseudomonas TaxID=286 RepID=UPI000A409E85|nr:MULTISPECIES: PilX N-terminal domain-containing pilus assembly protein [Pseudomonas]MCP1650737.1 type IV pilus assembly protein PilX [Pseudomonas nitroreducens]MCP1688689.1 type IV pilus assembly protein PilX [Pseudomonas nitroreducens]MDH0290725.1 PilX N-terminal domain-containing pilus assembly protein [Pseudomonas sp. GD04087]MDH1049039.1 PilX N-terminal domain-containing pilus assembly protein [Pseudomonas sp. GD03903]MDH2000544.1 PilX N-terminal domain-containing pilus assembly protein